MRQVSFDWQEILKKALWTSSCTVNVYLNVQNWMNCKLNLHPPPPLHPGWSGSSGVHSSPWCSPQHAASHEDCSSSGISWSDTSGIWCNVTGDKNSVTHHLTSNVICPNIFYTSTMEIMQPQVTHKMQMGIVLCISAYVRHFGESGLLSVWVSWFLCLKGMTAH